MFQWHYVWMACLLTVSRVYSYVSVYSANMKFNLFKEYIINKLDYLVRGNLPNIS